jgi:hypothetical protein
VFEHSYNNPPPWNCSQGGGKWQNGADILITPFFYILGPPLTVGNENIMTNETEEFEDL